MTLPEREPVSQADLQTLLEQSAINMWQYARPIWPRGEELERQTYHNNLPVWMGGYYGLEGTGLCVISSVPEAEDALQIRDTNHVEIEYKAPHYEPWEERDEDGFIKRDYDRPGNYIPEDLTVQVLTHKTGDVVLSCQVRVQPTAEGQRGYFSSRMGDIDMGDPYLEAEQLALPPMSFDACRALTKVMRNLRNIKECFEAHRNESNNSGNEDG